MLVSVSDYLALPRAPEAWIIDPIVPTGGTVILYGDAKLGKSYLALQLAEAIQLGSTWLGFPVSSPGRVAYLQLDTARGIWAERFERLLGGGFDPGNMLLGDRDTLGLWPFDALNPTHLDRLKLELAPFNPDVVIIDTLRAAHGGKENDSDVMQQVITRLALAVQPAALVIVSHSRKPSEQGVDVLNDQRGSNAAVGAVDTILRLTKRGLHFVGRAIEEGMIKIERLDNGLWAVAQADIDAAVKAVMADPTVPSTRAKAKLLAERIGKSEDAARSLLRRAMASSRSGDA